MSAKEIPLSQVPGIETAKRILRSINPEISVVAAGDDFDEDEYVLKITGPDRKNSVRLSYNLLRDVRDDKGQSGRNHTQELQSKLASILREGVEKMH